MTADDPIVRMQAMLGDALDAAEFEALWARAREEFADAVAFARSSPSPERDEAFFGRSSATASANDPVHASNRASATSSCRSRPDVGHGSQGSGH
jgi:TPP-dependent pyruvate/acetoin dehydrogenase alpha subunit